MSAFTINTTLDNPYPPKTVSLAYGAGTWTGSVFNTQPVGGPGFSGSSPIDISFYDSVTGLLGNPIASVKSNRGYTPTQLNLTFTTGLFAVIRSSSTVQITTP